MKLNDAQKAFIVEHLACFDTPQQVADAFEEEFDAELSRQQVEEYDPAKRCKTARWVEMHASIRKKFLDDVSEIPAAQRAYRVRRLALMATRSEARKNYPLAAQLYEQIAKEVGDAYTNRRELTGKDGKPLIPDRSLEDLSEVELAALAARLAEGGTS